MKDEAKTEEQPIDESAALRQRIATLKITETGRELELNYIIGTAVNALLRLSLEDYSLAELLYKALDIILSEPSFAFESKGSIFLVEEEPEVFVMKAQRGLTAPLLTKCARIPFSKCLCGRAATIKKIVFVGHIDDRHEISYEGMTPHGHYCVPIMLAGSTLGGINLYVRDGHIRLRGEEEFLNAAANTLAGIIKRKRAEEAFARSVYQNRLILEAVGDGIYGVDTSGNTSFVNPAAVNITGFRHDELIGKHQHECIHHTKPDGTLFPAEDCPIYMTLRDGITRRTTEDIFWKKEGMSFPVEYVSTPIIDKDEIVGPWLCSRTSPSASVRRKISVG